MVLVVVAVVFVVVGVPEVHFQCLPEAEGVEVVEVGVVVVG